jgi:hypothetical protein
MLACLALAATSGCGQLNASHLQHKPWQVGNSQNIHTKFFSFDFESIALSNQYGVKGAAHPVKNSLPPWADSVDNLSLTAYLCDEQGHILAQDKKYYLPQKLNPAGIPFDFFLKVKPSQEEKLFVSFGYRATFVASAKPRSADGGADPTRQHIFFASEDAVFSR